MKKTKILYICFIPAFLALFELIVRLVSNAGDFWALELIPIILYNLFWGLVFVAIKSLIKNKNIDMYLSILFMVVHTFLFGLAVCTKSTFGTCFGFVYAAQMAKNVILFYPRVLLETILKNIHLIIILFVPEAVYVFLNKKEKVENGLQTKGRLILLAVALACYLLTLPFNLDKAEYSYNYNFDSAVVRFGVSNSERLEIEYALFGMPEEKLEENMNDLFSSISENNVAVAVVTNETIVSENSTQDTEPKYGYHFAKGSLKEHIDTETNADYKEIDEYFNVIVPTKENEYTGMFKDKNVIFLTAEGFSGYSISEEHTPMLYKMSHEGFVFTEYYQPGWGLSTTGGEFANMCSIIPQFVNGTNCFSATVKCEMPYGLGNILSNEGYISEAYHNGRYTYYDRDKTHPNLGYDYKAIGGGLELKGSSVSDYELFAATLEKTIEKSKKANKPFNLYYMTISGHMPYDFSTNGMAQKNKAEAKAAYPDASPVVQAYYGTTFELERGMQYIYDTLKANDLLEDTIICMGCDHYPYGMAQKYGRDYYKELSGVNDTEADFSRYRNTWFLWSGAVKEPVVIDTPCSSLDMIPTLLNLLGVDFDSRFLFGRDMLDKSYKPYTASSNMPLVVFPQGGRGWISDAGMYYNRTFTPNEGVEVDEKYVEIVDSIAKAKWKYSKQVISMDYYRHLEEIVE